MVVKMSKIKNKNVELYIDGEKIGDIIEFQITRESKVQFKKHKEFRPYEQKFISVRRIRNNGNF